MRKAESRKTKTKREDRTCEIKCKHSRAKLNIPASSRPSKANCKLLYLLFQFLVYLYFLFALSNSFFVGERLFSRYEQDGTFFIPCRCTVDFVFRIYLVFRAKIHLQLSRIRVARLSICFGLQHWNFSHTMTLFELARRSEGFNQQIKSEKHS